MHTICNQLISYISYTYPPVMTIEKSREASHWAPVPLPACRMRNMWRTTTIFFIMMDWCEINGERSEVNAMYTIYVTDRQSYQRKCIYDYSIHCSDLFIWYDWFIVFTIQFLCFYVHVLFSSHLIFSIFNDFHFHASNLVINFFFIQ